MVDRWQQHYDEFMESVKEEGRLSLTTPVAARQYADDMMEEEGEETMEDCISLKWPVITLAIAIIAVFL